METTPSPDGRRPDSNGGNLGRGHRGPYAHNDEGLKPVPLNRMHPSYPREVVERALELMDEHGSVHGAQLALHNEMAEKELKAPGYSTLWRWAQEKETLLERLQGGRKDQLVAVASEVAAEAAGRMLEALPKLSDSQIPVAYGIAMQRRSEWEKTNTGGNQMNVQFNWVTRE